LLILSLESYIIIITIVIAIVAIPWIRRVVISRVISRVIIRGVDVRTPDGGSLIITWTVTIKRNWQQFFSSSDSCTSSLALALE